MRNSKGSLRTYYYLLCKDTRRHIFLSKLIKQNLQVPEVKEFIRTAIMKDDEIMTEDEMKEFSKMKKNIYKNCEINTT